MFLSYLITHFAVKAISKMISSHLAWSAGPIQKAKINLILRY